MRKGDSLMLGLICAAVAFVLTLQLKSVQSNNTDAVNMDKRLENLQQMLGEEREKFELQHGILEQTQEELNRYRNDSYSVQQRIQELHAVLARANLLAGLTPVQGPGLLVMIQDSIAPVWEGQAQANYLVHDSDLLEVLNELRDAGAEALSLNDQRILSTSEIRCAGSTVSINNTRTSAPFVIKAIGNPQTLWGALHMRGGVVERLERWEIFIQTTMTDQLDIPAYSGESGYSYAMAQDASLPAQSVSGEETREE